MKMQYDTVLLRTATEVDAKQLASWWNDGAVMAHAGFPNGLGITEDEVKGEISEGLLIIEENGKPIGETNYRLLDNNVAEIGIKICNVEYQNRGIGRKTLSLLIRHLFDHGIKKIILDTNLENKRAQHVYESLGFKKLRINTNSWTDQLGNKQSFVDYELVENDFINYIQKQDN